MNSPSLLQRALCDLDRGPSNVVELFGPAGVRALTVQHLRSLGCELTGDTPSVERLIAHECITVTNWLLDRESNSQPVSRGRPKNDLAELAIYAAAHYRFRELGPNAAGKAAQWLGGPATKDRVEKNAKQFLKLLNLAFPIEDATNDTALRCTARILHDVQLDLERLAAILSSERAGEAFRRKSMRHGSFSALN